VLLADDLMVGQPPVLAQIVEQFDEWHASIWLQVPPNTQRYGVAGAGQRAHARHHAHRRSRAEDAPSRLGVAGRYILTPGVREIANQQRGVGGGSSLPTASRACCGARRSLPTATRASVTTGGKEGFLR
jgi:UTP--glucose-1-phosphate uridylyltransferase